MKFIHILSVKLCSLFVVVVCLLVSFPDFVYCLVYFHGISYYVSGILLFPYALLFTGDTEEKFIL